MRGAGAKTITLFLLAGALLAARPAAALDASLLPSAPARSLLPPARPPGAGGDSSSRLHRGRWVFYGAGAVALVAGGVFYGQARSATADYEALVAQGADTAVSFQQLAAARDRADAATGRSRVALGTGLGLLFTGVLFDVLTRP